MRHDAVVVGGGFYGCCLAVHLRRRLPRVLLLERGEALMGRASWVNQARLHNGYHYPRSFLTAARSHANLAVFRAEFADAVVGGFRHLYAIAGGSLVGHRHFERAMQAIGAPLRPAPPGLRRLFDPRTIERVYEVEEPAFDADALRAIMVRRLADAGVEVRTATEVTALRGRDGGAVVAALAGGGEIVADWAFNCTYAALNQVLADPAGRVPGLSHQLTEVALIAPPEALRDLAITVMDGPFFSVMPFPPAGLHSLTHVRYTPHMKWSEAAEPEHVPQALLDHSQPQSRFGWMVRDAARYVPALAGARHVRSLYEIKSLWSGAANDDARPILCHRAAGSARIVSILGSKIDTIFDVYDLVDDMLES